VDVLEDFQQRDHDGAGGEGGGGAEHASKILLATGSSG